MMRIKKIFLFIAVALVFQVSLEKLFGVPSGEGGNYVPHEVISQPSYIFVGSTQSPPVAQRGQTVEITWTFEATAGRHREAYYQGESLPNPTDIIDWGVPFYGPINAGGTTRFTKTRSYTARGRSTAFWGAEPAWFYDPCDNSRKTSDVRAPSATHNFVLSPAPPNTSNRSDDTSEDLFPGPGPGPLPEPGPKPDPGPEAPPERPDQGEAALTSEVIDPTSFILDSDRGSKPTRSDGYVVINKTDPADLGTVGSNDVNVELTHRIVTINSPAARDLKGTLKLDVEPGSIIGDYVVFHYDSTTGARKTITLPFQMPVTEPGHEGGGVHDFHAGYEQFSFRRIGDGALTLKVTVAPDNGAPFKTSKLHLLPVEVEEVISDQIPNVEVNKLPSPFFGGVPTQDDPNNPCAGGTGFGNNPMLMGTRVDGKAYLKMRVNLGGLDVNNVPDQLLVGIRVVTEREHPTEPETRGAVKPRPSPELTYLSFTPLAEDGDLLPRYEVVHGWDTNSDGKLQTSEVKGFFQKTPLVDSLGTASSENTEIVDLIRIATPDHVNFSTDEIDNKLWWSVNMKYSEDLITSFITGDTTNVTNSHVTETSTTLSASDLSHPVGLNFNSAGAATTHQFNFDKDSEMSEDVYDSDGLETFLVNLAANSQQAIVQAAPAAPAHPGAHSYLLLEIPLGSSICFPGEYSSYGVQPPSAEARLFFGMKKAEISGAVLLKISRYYNDATLTSQRLEVSWDEIDAVLSDIYDFAYSSETLPRQAAIIQAGFSGVGAKGEPFRNRAVLKLDPDPRRFLIINL